MRVYGLTGGISTGKSTVAAMFAKRGIPVVDADVVAREVMAPGSLTLEKVRARFPSAALPDGTVDRAKLGALVFESATERAALNALTHPAIRERSQAKLDTLAQQGHARAIYDVPLLIENKLHEGMNGVVLVVVSPNTQLARLTARNQLSIDEAKQRIAAQLPLDEKRQYATWIIDNDGTLAETEAQVERIVEKMA